MSSSPTSQAVDVTMPQMGVSVAEGTIVAWHKRVIAISARLANDEIWMTQWIEHPRALKPGTAMPELNVSRRDALDIAAYLATMKE